MPPKEKGPSKKTEQKQKAKVVEDLTFGLKNKNKSAKVQQYVKQVQHQVMNGDQKKVSVSSRNAQRRVLGRCKTAGRIVPKEGGKGKVSRSEGSPGITLQECHRSQAC
jgi:hypothetical protein